jgi:hypothetical protein
VDLSHVAVIQHAARSVPPSRRQEVHTMIANENWRGFPHATNPSPARAVPFRGLASFIVCAFMSGCAAESGDPGGTPGRSASEVSEADDAAADLNAIAIICNRAVSPNALRFDKAAGEWSAEMRIRDDVVKNQIGGYDGLEQPYLRMIVDGRSIKVALDYQETVIENDRPVDVFRKAWKPEPAYEKVDEGVDFHLAINGRPNRYLCGRSIVSHL